MDKVFHLETPISAEDVSSLKSGDRVSISGTVYTARDAAHRRLFELIEAGKELPIPIDGPDHLLCGAVARASGSTHWCSGSHHQLSHGSVCP